MYISKKFKKFYVAFHKFNKRARNVSEVYDPGFHKWEADDSTNYSLVLGVRRIIFSINKEQRATCG